jgi:hypothetical protein
MSAAITEKHVYSQIFHISASAVVENPLSAWQLDRIR